MIIPLYDLKLRAPFPKCLIISSWPACSIMLLLGFSVLGIPGESPCGRQGFRSLALLCPLSTYLCPSLPTCGAVLFVRPLFSVSVICFAPGPKDTVVPSLSVDASVQLCETLCVCVCEALGRCVEVWHVQVHVTACTREGVCRAPISVPVLPGLC